MRVKSLLSSVSTIVASAAIISTVGVAGQAHAAAQTCTWTNGSGDLKFSTASNWSNCGSGVPQAGDIIEFGPISGTRDVAINNDLNVALGGVKGTGTGAATYYTMANDILLQPGAMVDDQDMTGGDISFKLDKGYHGQGDLTIVQGSVNRIKLDTGTLTLKGKATLRPTSDTVLVAGSPQNIVLENGATLNTCGIITNIVLPLVLGGGAATEPARVSVSGCMGAAGGEDPVVTTTITSITLNADAEVAVYGNDIVQVTNLNANGHTLKLGSGSTQYPADGTLILPDGSSQTHDYPVITTQLDGDKPTEYVRVRPNETAILNGSRCGVWVDAGGVLKGSGTLCSLVSYGTVSPGNSPGKITMTDQLTLAPGSTYVAEVASKDSYDQLVAKGARLTDSILDLKFLAGATVAAGDVYTIISNTNDAANPVDGTFRDLPEGATFQAMGGTFKISYVGGDGNDVVLTVVSVPTVPNTGFEKLASNPIAIVAGMSVVAIGLIAVARTARSRA